MAFGGNLDVRLKYQREFIYSDDEQKVVCGTSSSDRYTASRQRRLSIG